jgi:hypothetical protein
VSWLAACRQAQACCALLAGLAEIEALATEGERHTTPFVDRKLGVDQVAPMLPHPARPVLTAGFLVGEDSENEVPLQREPQALNRQHHAQFASHQPLGVDGTSSPDSPVDQFPTERVACPLVALHADDIAVGHEQERATVPPTAETGDQVAPTGCTFDDLGGYPLTPEYPREILGERGLVAGRIDRLEADQCLQVASDFVLKRIPIDSTVGHGFPPCPLITAAAVSTSSPPTSCTSVSCSLSTIIATKTEATGSNVPRIAAGVGPKRSVPIRKS